MRVVLASVIRQYLSERYSHFFFSSKLHYNDWDGSKFYHVACSPATVLPGVGGGGGESTMKAKNGYAETSIIDFPRGKLAKKSYFRGEILLYHHFQVGNSTMEKSVIFPG